MYTWQIKSWLRVSIPVIIALVFIGCFSLFLGCAPAFEPRTHTNSYPQNVLDSDVVWVIGSGVGTIYNQNLAGRITGVQNIASGSCPLGGTVSITGTTSYASNSGITTVNLTYNMTNCQISGSDSATDFDVMLTLTGTLTYTGSFSSGSTSTNFQSTGLQMNGVATRSGYTDGTISQNCSVSGTNNGAAIYGLIMCGRTSLK